MTFEPPLAPEYGPDDVSAVTTRTLSGERPKAAAAITAKPVFTPLMSAAAVTTVIVPSAFTRQTAAAGSLPPGQWPDRHPDPLALGKRAARSPERVLADPLEDFDDADDRDTGCR